MFSAIVNIYRLIGLPSFENSHSIDVEVLETPELRRALDAYNNSDSAFVSLEATELGQGELRVEIELPQRGDGYFYWSFADFFRSASRMINSGEMPENFYIRDLDYAFDEDFECFEEVANVYRMAEFVRDLRGFSAVALDEGYEANNSRVIFLRAADGKTSQQATTLKVDVSIESLGVPLSHSVILRHVKSAKQAGLLHAEERVVILNSAISEVISECEIDGAEFDYLVRNWRRVTKKYFNNLHAYMNGFSFDAIRKKITDSVIDSSSRINNAVGELGTKVLAVPVSVGALVALQNADSSVLFFTGLVGIVIVSIILRITIDHYRQQLLNLVGTFQFNMSATSSANRAFSASVKKEILRIENHIKEQRRKINATLSVYENLAAAPVFLGFVVAIYKYAGELDYFLSLYIYCYFDSGILGFVRYVLT